jgi:hypothetical protein
VFIDDDREKNVTAFIIAFCIAAATVLWFLRPDEVRSHQSIGGLFAGLLLATAVAASHFVGW